MAYTSIGDTYYNAFGGGAMNLPAGKYKDSGLPITQVTGENSVYARPTTLDAYIRWQILQSRRKYFLFHEYYRRDTWVRACIDYVVRRCTSEPNRLADMLDPQNPDIADVKEWLYDCYPNGDFEDIYSGVVQDLLEYMQGYVYIERNGAGDPIHLWPMDSRITFPVTDWHGSIMFHVQVYNGYVEVFEREEVLYFARRNNGTDHKGIPAIETLLDSITMELHANRFNMKLFENNLNIGAIFSVPNATDEDIEDNLRYLDDHYATPENAHRPLILKNDAKLLRDGALASKDINFELLIKLARHRVCSAFGVPESLLGIPDNTNRATANTHERNTYVNTVRPLRRYVNRTFSRQLFRSAMGAKSIELREPVSSMLPTKEELDAASVLATNGVMFNDLLEMEGLERVPNGDYYVMKGPNGTYQRLDLIAMPGLGDKHFDFEAYQLWNEQQKTQSQDMALQGVQPSPPDTPYVAPRPQDTIKSEPITARIVDISRSLIERRTPMLPGSRGSTQVYTTKGGKLRYGTPPKNKVPSPQTSGGETRENTLTNPRDANVLKTLTPEERLQSSAAHAQVEGMFRQAQEENWTDEQFMAKMDADGWLPAANSVMSRFQDARDARREARRLAEINPAGIYTILGSGGTYFIMEQELANFAHVDAQEGEGAKGTSPNKPPQNKDPQTSPTTQEKGKKDKTIGRSFSGPDGVKSNLMSKLRAFLEGDN